MWNLEADTGILTLPIGDTMEMPISVKDEAAKYSGRKIFAVFRVWDETDGKWVISKAYEAAADGTVSLSIYSRDTRDLDTSHSFKWTVGVGIDLDTDENGNLIAKEDTDVVMTAHNAWRTFKLTPNGILRRS